MRIQFSLSRKSDADLISFFLQQDERVASLVVAALCAYIKGERINIPLHPVTIMEQNERLNVSITLQDQLNRKKETPERIEMLRSLKEFLNTIPSGMVAMYCKGILRYMYGHVIYQTEATKCQKNTEPTYITIPSETITKEPMTVQTPEVIKNDAMQPIEVPEDTEEEDDDDIFDLFESML